MTHIVISINSDLDPVTYFTNTPEEIGAARLALRDAGLAYEDEWVGEPGTGDEHKNGSKLFAQPIEVGGRTLEAVVDIDSLPEVRQAGQRNLTLEEMVAKHGGNINAMIAAGDVDPL